MNMTHYMELLAVNQPWNLLIFMAVPVILAETVAITELYILYARAYDGVARQLNRLASIVGGIYFAGVFVYLMATAVLPITQAGAWRGPADYIAVFAYLAGVVPLGMIALIDLKLVAKDKDEHARMGLHALWVAVFLVVAHIAMVFGMLDPTVLGGKAGGHAH
ncbi:MAG TPA: permease [Beijerinckiaceae bacterium]|nr:permease [Beijerinckiaceae bacterium]